MLMVDRSQGEALMKFRSWQTALQIQLPNTLFAPKKRGISFFDILETNCDESEERGMGWDLKDYFFICGSKSLTYVLLFMEPFP